MIGAALKPLWRHLYVRAVAILRTPAALVALILFGIAGMIYWPGISSADIMGTNSLDRIGAGMPLRLLRLFWFFLWPMLPMVYVRGRATGKNRSNPLAVLSVPALPVGLRQRVFAEAILALGVMSIVRIAGTVLFQEAELSSLVVPTLAGAVFLLPMTLAWGIPTSNLNLFMWRPLVAAFAATLLQSIGGIFNTWPGMVVAGLALSAAVIASTRFEVRGLRLKNTPGLPNTRIRPALDPESQLRRDAWRPTMRTWGPWFAAATIAFAITLVLDIRGIGWDWAFFAGFEVFLIIGLQPLFRPFGLNLVAESLVGKHGAERGDFMRAWSVLPVTREAVLRRTWLHGIFAGLLLWAIPVGLLSLRARLRLGDWGFRAADGGNLGEFVLLGAAIVPMMAGLLVAAGLGRKLETAVSGIITLAGIYSLLPVKIALYEIFGSGSTIAGVGLTVYFAALVLAASLPPLRFLFRVQRIEAFR